MQLCKLLKGVSVLCIRGRPTRLGWDVTPITRISRPHWSPTTTRALNLIMATASQDSPESSIPAPETRSDEEVHGPPADYLEFLVIDHSKPRVVDPERAQMPSSASMADLRSQVEATVPELLPLWLRHGHKVPEQLAQDLNLGGTLSRVKLCEVLDRASLSSACDKAMSGFPLEAANALESLLALELKLSYLSAMTPQALKDYTECQDAGSLGRRSEIALLERLSTQYSFPCKDNASAVLPLLADHLQLDLRGRDTEAWAAVIAAFKRAHPWAVRTECLLTEGCDDRITVPYATGKMTNKYHCSPVPTPEVVSRSSCTSNSASRRSFRSADDTREEMLLDWALQSNHVDAGEGYEALTRGKSFTERMSDIRRRLLDVLTLNEGSAEVFLTPSGSDAELLPMALAWLRSRRLGHKASDGPAVTSIVVAAGEVGSGTAFAAGGKHFSNLTPRGAVGHPARHVKGMSPRDVKVIEIKCRSKTGAFLPCEDNVSSAIDEAMSSCATSVAVAHFVAGSKTGTCSPTVDVISKLKKKHGERLVVVVDACQLRSDAENIVEYASKGFITLVTGSKFYCGPPFSGAVLFPPAALAELEAGFEHLPPGFEDYFSRHEVDTKYSILRSRLADWENRGLLLRWVSALTNIEAIKTIPKKNMEIFAQRWVKEVRDSVQSRWPYLSLLPDQGGVPPCRVMGQINTIVALMVQVPLESEGSDGNPEVALGYDDLRLFHRLLSEDISKLLPQGLAISDYASARLRVLCGQPVKLGGASFGVIRIALGADMLIDSYCAGNPPTAGEINAMTESTALNRLVAQAGVADADIIKLYIDTTTLDLPCLWISSPKCDLKGSFMNDRLAVDKCCLMARHWHFLKEAAMGKPTADSTAQSHKVISVKTLVDLVQNMGKDELSVLETLMQARYIELQKA